MDKATFRKECKKKLTSLTCLYYRDMLINRRLQSLLNRLKPKEVLLYHPFLFEPDIRKTIARLRKSGVIVYLPLMGDVSFILVKYRLPLRANSLDIKEPDISKFNLAKPQVAVIPVVGVDKNFKRIGFGKGMYDRFFASKKGVRRVFVQRELCYINHYLTQDFDVGADFFITPSQNIKVRRDRYGNRVGYYKYRSVDTWGSDRVCNLQKTKLCKL